VKYILPLIALLAASPLAAQPFTVAATKQGYPHLADAVAAIGDKDGTVLIAPGVYHECVIQGAGAVTYRAVRPGTAIFDGTICEGKAVLVLRGRAATVDGLVFRHLRTDDGNGAGIRAEHGPLTVINSAFRDSEEGILGNDDLAADIRIDRSTFSGLGRCDRGLSCAHSIYIGHFRSVTVRHSRFDRGQGGHYVKSRSAKIDVSDCSFDDVRGHTTNYMIDLPSGASGAIRRNVFVQGRDKENHSAIIAVAAEGRDNPSAGLTVAGNRAHQVAGISWPTALVVDWSGSKMAIAGNVLGPNIETYRTQQPPAQRGTIGQIFYYAGKLKQKLRDKVLG
jgi:hypothetical protein